MPSIPLPAIFDLSAAAALADQLNSTPGAVALKGHAVERVGVAGLQVLLTAHLTRGGTLRIDAPSAALRAAARTAALDFLFAPMA